MGCFFFYFALLGLLEGSISFRRRRTADKAQREAQLIVTGGLLVFDWFGLDPAADEDVDVQNERSRVENGYSTDIVQVRGLTKVLCLAL